MWPGWATPSVRGSTVLVTLLLAEIRDTVTIGGAVVLAGIYLTIVEVTAAALRIERSRVRETVIQRAS